MTTAIEYALMAGAVYVSIRDVKNLEMLRDLDRNQRHVLSRIWTEIKLK